MSKCTPQEFLNKKIIKDQGYSSIYSLSNDTGLPISTLKSIAYDGRKPNIAWRIILILLRKNPSLVKEAIKQADQDMS